MPLKQAAASLARIYQDLYQQARALFPQLPPEPPDLIVTPKAQTTDRSFAFFQYDPRQAGKDKGRAACSVSLSPALANDRGHAVGVTAHEIGHYCDFALSRAALLDALKTEDGRSYAAAGIPLPRSKERLADAIAEAFTGLEIRYSCTHDGDCRLVQTMDGPGIRPRPSGLG